MIYYTKFNFVRSNVNTLNPRVVEKGFFNAWVIILKNVKSNMTIFTYVAIGIMLLMIFYSIALYIENKSPEFLFYSSLRVQHSDHDIPEIFLRIQNFAIYNFLRGIP